MKKRVDSLVRLCDIQALSPVIKEQALANIEQQRQTLLQRLQDKQALVSMMYLRYQ